MRKVFEDEFHKQMRERMTHNYYFKGGKERAQIRKYLSRYKLDKSYLEGCTTHEEKLAKMIAYAEARKKKNCSK